MINFNYYGKDGAYASSRAVLALAQGMSVGIFEDKDANEHKINVARWSNYREQGYVLCIKPFFYKRNEKQLNIAWFEHRNSGNICVVVWKQDTLDAPTIHTANFGDIYKDKYDVSASFSYDKHYEVAEFIVLQMQTYIDLAKNQDTESYEVVHNQ